MPEARCFKPGLSPNISARYCKLLHAKSCQQRTSGQTRFDDLAVRAEKLPGCIVLTLCRPFECAVMIFALLASFTAHRALHKCTLSRTNRGVSEESRWTALTEQATA
jgi:hypothetical protein